MSVFCSFKSLTFTLCASLLSRFLSIVGGSADQIGSAGLRQCVESKVRTSSVEGLARTVDTTPETLKLIIDGLTQPPGFDIRQSKTPAAHSRTDILISTNILTQHKQIMSRPEIVLMRNTRLTA